MEFLPIIAVFISFSMSCSNALEQPNCASVDCLAVTCSACEIPVLFEDSCCPVCRKVPGVNATYLSPVSPDCPILPCPYPFCQSGEEALARPDECCATVCVQKSDKPDCALVDCLPITCVDGDIPVHFEEACCAECVYVPGVNATYLGPVSPDCPVLPCPLPNCQVYEEALAAPGQCCPLECVTKPGHVDCNLVDCRPLTCSEGEIPVKFQELCCPVCVNVPGVNVSYLGPLQRTDCPMIPCYNPNCETNEEALVEPDGCCPTVCVAIPCDLL